MTTFHFFSSILFPFTSHLFLIFLRDNSEIECSSRQGGYSTDSQRCQITKKRKKWTRLANGPRCQVLYWTILGIPTAAAASATEPTRLGLFRISLTETYRFVFPPRPIEQGKLKNSCSAFCQSGGNCRYRWPWSIEWSAWSPHVELASSGGMRPQRLSTSREKNE